MRDEVDRHWLAVSRSQDGTEDETTVAEDKSRKGKECLKSDEKKNNSSRRTDYLNKKRYRQLSVDLRGIDAARFVCDISYMLLDSVAAEDDNSVAHNHQSGCVDAHVQTISRSFLNPRLLDGYLLGKLD